MNVNQLPEYAIPLSPLHHKKSGWRYPGNKESCQRSAGFKKTGFSGAFQIPECEEFSIGGEGGYEEAGEGEVAVLLASGTGFLPKYVTFVTNM